MSLNISFQISASDIKLIIIVKQMGCRMCSQRTDQIKIVIGGLSKSGKTVIFFKLTDHPEFIKPVPTIGYNSEIISYRNRSINITDIGSKQPSRASINTFVDFSKGFIFVIDTSNRENLQKSRQKFNEYLMMRELNKLPILFYLNNRDNTQIK